MTRVLVCGVGGTTGDAVLTALVERGVQARALVHGFARVPAALSLGATDAVVADYNDHRSLCEALQGMDAVYFVAPVYRNEEPRWTQQMLDAAKAVGEPRFVYHSVLHAYTPSMPHHLRKAESELAVRRSALKWTVLQPAMYAQTVLRMRARSPQGQFAAPYDPDSLFTVIDVRDVGVCAAEVLTEQGHDFAGYEVAGSTVQSVRMMAETMNAVLGESREVVRIDPSALPLLPSWDRRQRDEYAAMCADYDAHGLLGPSGVATWLMGRPPTEFASVVERDADRTPH